MSMSVITDPFAHRPRSSAEDKPMTKPMINSCYKDIFNHVNNKKGKKKKKKKEEKQQKQQQQDDDLRVNDELF